jgi:hypothetical protein
MYNQRYRPFSQTSDNGHWCLKVAFLSIEIQQHGETYPVQEPWFTLEDTITKKVVWSRKGNWRIDDAHALFVSDDGWSVIRFHGISTYSRLLAIPPEGNDVLTVGITGFVRPYVTDPPIKEGKWELWLDEHVEDSTAGDSWSYRARFRFCTWSSNPLFVSRTRWGRYLVLDLNGERVVDEQDVTRCVLFDALRSEDGNWALEILREARGCKDELQVALAAQDRADESTALPKQLAELWDRVFNALLIVRQDRIAAAAPLLEELQAISNLGFGGFVEVTPVKNFGSRFVDLFREYVHLAMLRIGVRPKRYALMVFNEVCDSSCPESRWLRLPECVENRESLICSLVPGMKPDDVAFIIGAPEFIRGSSEDRETCPWQDEFYFECWDYDEPDRDVTPASWALLWRKPKEPMSDEEKNLPLDEFVAKCKEFKERELPTELISITRFVWDDAYWMMREENIPISLARERLAQKQPRPTN